MRVAPCLQPLNLDQVGDGRSPQPRRFGSSTGLCNFAALAAVERLGATQCRYILRDVRLRIDALGGVTFHRVGIVVEIPPLSFQSVEIVHRYSPNTGAMARMQVTRRCRRLCGLTWPSFLSRRRFGGSLRTRQAVLFLCLVSALGCGGDQDSAAPPTSPSISSPPETICRSFPSQAFIDTVGSDSAGQTVYRASVTSVCAFDNRTATLTCNATQSVTLGGTCNLAISSATVWHSVGEFVAEGKPPGKTLIQSTVSTVTGFTGGSGCGGTNGTTTTTYAYDGQSRVVSLRDDRGTETTYGAWDSLGRPTRGTTTASVCAPAQISLSYNDAARTVAVVDSCAVAPTTLTTTYDVEGNPAMIVFRGMASGAGSSTQTVRTLASAQICR